MPHDDQRLIPLCSSSLFFGSCAFFVGLKGHRVLFTVSGESGEPA
jgi:hypothetical protein